MLSDFLFRLRALFRKKPMESELDEELRAHIERQAEKYVQSGMPRDKALRRARLEFGGLEQVKEDCRDARGVRFIETMLQDIRYGLRQLRRNPGFTAVAVLTLALGIGANTAAFSVVYGILFRPLPYEHPDRLTFITQRDEKTDQQSLIPTSEFFYMREHNQALADLAAFSLEAVHLGNVSQPRSVRVIVPTSNYFGLLGVRPILGREFLRSEEKSGENHVAILSHGLWQQEFGADPNIIGRTLRLNETIYTIVGVMPSGFATPQYKEIDMWIPLASEPSEKVNPRFRDVAVLGRLKPNQKIEQAQAYLQTMAHAWSAEDADGSANVRIIVDPLREMLVGDSRQLLLTLFGMVSLVLLIACANLANLLLSKATVRQKEFAVRMALGASRLRVLRQVVTECMLLALGGGAVSILLAVWAVDFLKVSLATRNFPRMDEVVVDSGVLMFALAISVLTGLVVGLFPALRGLGARGGPSLGESLKEGGHAVVAASGRSGARSVLVVSEVAMSLMLTVGAGLMVRTFLNLRPVNTGFDPANKLRFSYRLLQTRYPNPVQRTAFLRDVIERIEAVSAVKSVAAASMLPMSGFAWGAPIRIPERPSESEKPNWAYRTSITDNYLHVMRIDLLAGRSFTVNDSEKALPVALVNQTAARALWPGENPLGKQILISEIDPQKLWRVVGVTADVRQFGFDTRPRLQVYLPYRQEPTAFVSLVVQSAGDSEKLVPVVRGQIAGLDKDLDLFQIRTMEDQLSESVVWPHFYAFLVGAFALLGLVLASVGVYGVTSYSVAQRTHEIGVRMALGAERSDVLKLVVGQGLKLTLIGVAIGIAGAFGLTRFLSSLLYGIKPTDPLTFVAVSLLLTVVALLASYIPARRATKVDPMVALRYE